MSTVVAGVMTVAAVGVGQLALGGGVAGAAPSSATVNSDNIQATKKVEPAVARPGDIVTTTITLRAPNGVDRYLSDFTDYPPAGYILQGVTGSVPRGAGGGIGSTYDNTLSQNASNGSVKLEWNGSVNRAKLSGGSSSNGPNLTFTYKVPDNAPVGPRSAGLSFSVVFFSSNPQTFNPMTGLNLAVEATPTTTTLSAPATAVVGASATLTANVSPAKPGTVQFKDGGVNIGAPVAVSNGTASLPHTFTSAGAHAITAQFVPSDSNVAGSTSTAQTVNVSDVTTDLSLTVPGSALTGAPVTLTANVAPQNAAGSVQFKDNGADIGAPVTVAGGAASMQHTFSAAGAHSITAVFTGAAGFANSTAAAQGVTVSDPDVVTSLTVQAPATATTGSSVDLTATVSPSNAQGSVQFKDNGADIGSPVTVANGEAVLPHSFDSAGAHSITAEFTGAAGFTNSSAAAQSVTVSDPDVETSLTVGAPATATTGTSVDLTATVSPSSAQGTVQFKDNGSNIGAPVTVANGEAVLPHSFDSAGAHSITAEFTGAVGFTNSSATAHSVTVTDPDVETSLTVSVPATATTGTSVNLTATVDPSNAQGAVQFTDNGAPIGNPVDVVNGVATLPHTFTAAGERSIGASFTGGLGFTDSSAVTPGSITVSDPVQQTALSVAAPATAETGQQVNLSATVTPQNAQGTVQFSVNGSPAGAPVAVSAGTATLPYTFNAAGSFEVTAEFTGAAGFTNSTASGQTVTVTDPVIPDVATSTLIGVPSTATTGVETTLSVTVNAQSGSAVPTGSVQFQDNGSPIGSPVVLVNGSGSLAYAFSTVGTHQITAVFAPDTGFAGSTSTQRPIVVSAPNPVDVPSSVVMTSATSASAGTPFKLAAKVIGAPVLPGTVQFYDGGVALGQPVPVVNGIAELEHTFDQSGPRQIHAVYSGGSGVQGSTSQVQVLDVAESGEPGGSGSLGSLGSLSGFRFGS